MPLGQEELDRRRDYVGASDVACLFGRDPFKDMRSLMKSKVDAAPDISKSKVGSAVWYGNHLESAVLGMAAEQLEMSGVAEQAEFRRGYLCVHPDALAQSLTWRGKRHDTPFVIEIKTTGFSGQPAEAGQWGRAGSKNIPLRVWFQVQAQLHATQEHDDACTRAFVCLLSGHDARGLSIYIVDYNKKLGQMIDDRVNRFWDSVLQARERACQTSQP